MFITKIFLIIVGVLLLVIGGHAGFNRPPPPTSCPLTNRCYYVKSWTEYDLPVTQYNCSLTNYGRDAIGSINLGIYGSYIKDIWELTTNNGGKSWDLVEWRKQTPIQPGQAHTWGYNVHGQQELYINPCNNFPPTYTAGTSSSGFTPFSYGSSSSTSGGRSPSDF
ncbi:hypothetical protein DFA_03926 [Cavenderia fasciculata]|uniref:Carbohydrate binding domain-containing protein n=1 Tax=Cavenderia fasciculata TaxID=261658 RepID=F4Q0T1_CACFS|nr:uncharacterized protein DFA_03926 [Cavenderia fasciculata]EGG18432.1 hypothetical protein DFA_03926 [Cavenderia fasciculata]|eukprot:XP_004366336.1 hypothetical protein DFA_03926 [Cavenderia fasciculata]